MKSVRRRYHVSHIVLGVVMTLSGSVIAQTAQPDALSGPAVREGGVPGDSKSFTGGRRREGDRPLAHRMFLQSLDVIRGEKAAAATRLTAEQEKSLRDFEKAFQTDQRAYFEKNREAIQKAREALGLKGEMEEGDGFRRGVEEIRRALQEKKAPAKKPEPATEPAEESMMSEDAMNEALEKARGQLQRIYANAPKPADVHTRQWAVLTVAQQEIVIKEIDRLQASEGEDRKNYLGRRDTLKQDMEDIVAGKKEVDVNDPRLPEAMREKLAAMTPDQRREAVRKFMVERGRKAAAGTEKKAAPTMDDVVLPPPEEPGEDEKDEK